MSAAIACWTQSAERTGAPDCTTCTAFPLLLRNLTTSCAPIPMHGVSARMAALKDQALASPLPDREGLHEHTIAPNERAVAAREANRAAGLGRLLLGDHHGIGMAAEVERAPAIRVCAAAAKLEIGRLVM